VITMRPPEYVSIPTPKSRGPDNFTEATSKAGGVAAGAADCGKAGDALHTHITKSKPAIVSERIGSSNPRAGSRRPGRGSIV
jgi:hypothetical protein